MIAPWLFFALFTPALYAVANYCDKVLLDHFRIKPIELCGLVYIGFAVCSLGLAVCGDGPVAPLGAGLLPFFTGVLFTLYALPYYRALMLDEASVIIPLFQFSPLFVIAFEVALMGIRLSPEQVLGTVLILVCGFACAVERDSERIFRVRPALWYMLLAGALYAASGPLMSFGLKENSLISFLFYQGLGMLLTGIVLYLYGRERTVGDRPRTSGLFWGILTLNCVVATVALVGAIRAVDEVAVSLVRVVEASQPIFVFVLGALLTQLYPTYVNERISRRIVLKKLLIGVGMIVGAFFLQKM